MPGWNFFKFAANIHCDPTWMNRLHFGVHWSQVKVNVAKTASHICEHNISQYLSVMSLHRHTCQRKPYAEAYNPKAGILDFGVTHESLHGLQSNKLFLRTLNYDIGTWIKHAAWTQLEEHYFNGSKIYCENQKNEQFVVHLIAYFTAQENKNPF